MALDNLDSKTHTLMTSGETDDALVCKLNTILFEFILFYLSEKTTVSATLSFHNLITLKFAVLFYWLGDTRSTLNGVLW